MEGMSLGDGGVIQDVGWDTNKGDKVAAPSGKGLSWNCCFAGVLGWNSIFLLSLLVLESGTLDLLLILFALGRYRR